MLGTSCSCATTQIVCAERKFLLRVKTAYIVHTPKRRDCFLLFGEYMSVCDRGTRMTGLIVLCQISYRYASILCRFVNHAIMLSQSMHNSEIVRLYLYPDICHNIKTAYRYPLVLGRFANHAIILCPKQLVTVRYSVTFLFCLLQPPAYRANILSR